jgi:hypothetical protein
MTRPFEDPRKTEMRSRCEVAIDAAGHDQVQAPLAIPLPLGSALRGSIKGDLQSVDGDGIRYCYYLRPGGTGALPQWLANFATVAQEIENCCFCVVVEEDDAQMVSSCRRAGAGLLLLTQESSFEWLVHPSEWSPDADRAAFLEQVRVVRRRLEAKLELNVTAIQENFSNVQQLTQGLSADRRDEYVRDLEVSHVMWREWSDSMSARLDQAAARQDDAELKAIERQIMSGPLNDDIEPEDS